MPIKPFQEIFRAAYAAFFMPEGKGADHADE